MTGTCPVCGRTFTLNAMTGRLLRHGYSLRGRDGQCARTNQPPQHPQHVDQPRTHPRRTE